MNSYLENATPHAVAGNTDAQCTIASMYQCGFGVQRDFLEAERWLLKQRNRLVPWRGTTLGRFTLRNFLVLKAVGRSSKMLGQSCGTRF